MSESTDFINEIKAVTVQGKFDREMEAREQAQKFYNLNRARQQILKSAYEGKNGTQVKISLKEKPSYGAMAKLVEMYQSVPEFKGFEIKQDMGCYNNIIFRWGKVMEAQDERD